MITNYQPGVLDIHGIPNMFHDSSGGFCERVLCPPKSTTTTSTTIKKQERQEERQAPSVWTSQELEGFEEVVTITCRTRGRKTWTQWGSHKLHHVPWQVTEFPRYSGKTAAESLMLSEVEILCRGYHRSWAEQGGVEWHGWWWGFKGDPFFGATLGRDDHSEILETWVTRLQWFESLQICESLSFTMFFFGVRCRISSRWWALHPCTQPWTAPWMRWKTGWGESQGRLSGPDHSRMFRLHVDKFLKFVLGMISDLTRDDEQKRGPCSWLVGNLLWSIKCKRVDVLKQTPGWTLMEIGSRKDWVAEAVAWKSAQEINIHRHSRWKQQVS